MAGFEIPVVTDSEGGRSIIRLTPDQVIETLRGPKGDKGDPGLTPEEIESLVDAYMAENPTGVPGLYTGRGAPGTIVGSAVGSSYIDLDTFEIYRLGD